MTPTARAVKNLLAFTGALTGSGISRPCRGTGELVRANQLLNHLNPSKTSHALKPDPCRPTLQVPGSLLLLKPRSLTPSSHLCTQSHAQHLPSTTFCSASATSPSWHPRRSLASSAQPDGSPDNLEAPLPGEPAQGTARPGGASRREDDLPYMSEPWTYTLTEIPPDTTASRLSDLSKEAMYTLHKKDPVQWTAARLAKEYRIREQRAHAILWLKELEKQAEAELGKPLDDSLQKEHDVAVRAVTKAAREQHITIYPSEEVDAIEDHDERMTKLLEESAREEKYKVEEFVRRVEFNKLQMSGAVKVNPIDRKRPEEGWSYVVEELGEEGRRGKSGGRRYVVRPDGSKRPLNEIEKKYVAREKNRPRRRIV